MSNRNERAIAVSMALEGVRGWNRDPYDAGVLPDWDQRFPDVPVVSDSRDVTGNTRAGRGTTAFDLFCQVGEIRSDFLSIKTETIEPSGKLVSKLSLSTGNIGTLAGIIDGCRRGAALPTLVFASMNTDEGIAHEGLALFLDLGKALRGHIPPAPEEGWGRGKAPPAYLKWSSRRKTGSGHKAATREGSEFPFIDDEGRRWSAPNYVHYRELTISLAGMGISRNSWVPCSISDLPAFVESQDWDALSWGSGDEMIG